MSDLIPRQQWLKNYINECINRIKLAQMNDDWIEYLKNINMLSDELKWATTEWEKCYEVRE